MLDRRRACRSLPSSPFAKFTQKLLRWYKEWILLEDAADDDQRMRAHDVNYSVSAEFRKAVGADDRIIVATPHIIDPRFKLNQIVDVRLTVRHPVRQTMRLRGNPPSA